MTYKFTRVAKLQQHTEHLRGYIEDIPEAPLHAVGVRVLDGFPVTPKMAEVADVIRSAIPGIKFAPHPSAPELTVTVQWTDDKGGEQIRFVEVCHVLHLMLPNQPYGLGTVFMLNSSTHAVCAPTIVNNRYREDNKNFNTLCSESLVRFIKLVKKHIRPMTTTQIAARSGYDMHSHVQNSVWAAERAKTEAKSAIVNGSGFEQLERTLSEMVRMGTITDPELKTNVERYFTAKKEAKELTREMATPVTFVHLSGTGEYATANLVRYASSEKTHRALPNPEQAAVPMHMLSEDIAGYVAALSMVEPGRYVPGIGYRASDTEYWVFQRAEGSNE